MRLACRIAAIVLTLAIGAAVAGAAPPVVIDDQRLLEEFRTKLGRLLAEGTSLDAADARQQATAVTGRRIAAADPAAACRILAGQALYEAVTPAVVVVASVFKCDKCNDWHLGQIASGWLASADGLVVTNHHVIERDAGNKYGVMTSDGDVFTVSEVVAAAPAGDAAVLRIDTRGRKLPFLLLGPPPACGDPVSVISHPKGRFYCLSEGVVSRYHSQRRRDGADEPARDGPRYEPAVWMSVTADFAIGSSGGPVLDASGRVVGMVSRTVAAIADPSAGDRQKGGKPTEQMTFKDCVSPETLRALLKADD